MPQPLKKAYADALPSAVHHQPRGMSNRSSVRRRRILDATERYKAPPTETEMEALAKRAAMSPLFV
jgi:hypothetical protein